MLSQVDTNDLKDLSLILVQWIQEQIRKKQLAKKMLQLCYKIEILNRDIRCKKSLYFRVVGQKEVSKVEKISMSEKQRVMIFKYLDDRSILLTASLVSKKDR